MFILDTDHFTLHLHGHQTVTRNMMEHNSSTVAVSIVTVEETLTGWYSTIRQAKALAAQIQAYAGLFRSMQAFQTIELAPFSPDALLRFRELRIAHRRLGRMDLSIAAIALEFNATLVTRNLIDFEQIPGLKIEDWSQPESGDADHA